MALKKLLIFPFNGNGIEALDCFNNDDYEFIGFVDDAPEKQGNQHDWPVYNREVLMKYKEAFVLAVPGSPLSFKRRGSFIQSLQLPDDRFVTIVHPKATIGKSARIGINCLIMAGVVITSNGQIGNHVCILPNTVVHHDSIIGDLTLIGSNVAVAGATTIGRNCYIGSGSNIINGIHIGDRSLVGMGSNVVRSFPEDSTIIGNPARQFKKEIS